MAESQPEEVVEGWNVLVVDDDPDVHAATILSIKRKTWRKRPFVVKSVHSAKEARDLLRQGDYRNRLHVALIDVVMETRLAGLDLCRFIRSELPRSVRIILRTGQPGVAPEERVINDYDIDYYFSKPEATADRLYTALRACLRSSQDIETLLAFGNQLRSFTTALQKATSREDLATFMRVGLDFLELKHSARIVFIPDIDDPDETVPPSSQEFQAVARAHSLQLELGKIHPASSLGLDEDWFVLAFTATGKTSARGGFVIQRMRSLLHGLQSDLLLFLQNWTIAWSNCVLTLELAEERKLLELKVEERTRELSLAYENLEKLFKELEAREEVITQDLIQAREFQQSILTKPPDIPGVGVEILYRPVDLVGGDLYDVAAVNPTTLRVFLADATGHGVRAALTTMFIKSEYEAIKHADGPAAVLGALNERIAGTYGLLGMRFTAVCALIDLERRVVRWSSGGHLDSFVRSKGGDVRELDGAGPFMGVVPGITFSESESELAPGDSVVFYTDGITEAVNARGEAFGDERLVELLRRGPSPNRPISAGVAEELDRFLEGRPPQDDVAFVVISALGPGAEQAKAKAGRTVVELEITYDWKPLDEARNTITSALASAYTDQDLRDSLLMVATELLENAVKYGKHDDGIRLCITDEDDRITLAVTSGIDDAAAAALDQRLEWLRRFPSPMEAFRAASSEVYDRPPDGRSGLGLARVAAEGECEIERSIAGNRLTVRAIHKRPL